MRKMVPVDLEVHAQLTRLVAKKIVKEKRPVKYSEIVRDLLKNSV